MYVPNVPFAQLRWTTNTTVANNTNTIVALSWSTVYLNNMSVVSNNYLRVLYPGVYVTNLTLAWAVNASGTTRTLAYVVNNTASTFYYGMNAVRPAQDYGTIMTASAMLYLNSGDIIYPYAFQDSGSTLIIGNVDTIDRCLWTMHKISG